MTEYGCNQHENKELICGACLVVDTKAVKMTYEELTWYQMLVSETMEPPSTNVCAVCHHLLRKCIKFTKQCRQAAYLFGRVVQIQETKPLTWLNKFTFTSTTHYLGPDFEKDLDSESERPECLDANSDDDLPLVMLQDERDRNSGKEIDLQSFESQFDENSESFYPSTEIKKEKEAKSSKKKKKELKEGFTSRMVQETDEYIVIKLNKEQVLREMEERRESEKYKRSLFKCEQCVKGFNFEDVLQAHMVKHTKQNGEFECDICGHFCPSMVSMRGHMKSHTTRYKCKLCGTIRLSRQHLLEHHASHTGQVATYNCQYCDFTTQKRTVIQRHVKTHNKSERHTCEQCGRLFSNIESLRVHTTRHKRSLAQCSQCPRRFVLPSLLHKHELSVHKRRDYYCVECDLTFKSSDNLRLHFKKAKRHRDASSYTSHCSQCPARFVSASSLAAHLASVHAYPKSFSCHICRRLYSSRESLKCHIRRVHIAKEAAKNFCHICKRSFSRKSVLIVHTKTHHETEYECE